MVRSQLFRSLFKMVPTCFTECVEFNFFSYNWICGSVCLKKRKGGGLQFHIICTINYVCQKPILECFTRAVITLLVVINSFFQNIRKYFAKYICHFIINVYRESNYFIGDIEGANIATFLFRRALHNVFWSTSQAASK